MEEEHDNYIAAMRKWVISGSEKNKSEQEHKQQIFGEHIRQFLHKKIMCN